MAISAIAFFQTTKAKGRDRLVNKYKLRQPQDFSVPLPVNPFLLSFLMGIKHL